MIRTFSVTGWGVTNCYFLGNAKGRGFLIDPGAEGERLLERLDAESLIVEKILITHGHFDHIGAAPFLARALQVPVLMRRDGRPYAESAWWNLSALAGEPLQLKDVTYFQAGDVIRLASDPAFAVEAIAAPGHTADGTVYYAASEQAAFVGDTIFAGSRGRTDLPGRDERALLRSIQQLLLQLPEETRLYSGHSAPTTVAAEKPLYL